MLFTLRVTRMPLAQKGELGRAKGGLNSKLHIAVDAHGNPV